MASPPNDDGFQTVSFDLSSGTFLSRKLRLAVNSPALPANDIEPRGRRFGIAERREDFFVDLVAEHALPAQPDGAALVVDLDLRDVAVKEPELREVLMHLAGTRARGSARGEWKLTDFLRHVTSTTSSPVVHAHVPSLMSRIGMLSGNSSSCSRELLGCGIGWSGRYCSFGSAICDLLEPGSDGRALLPPPPPPRFRPFEASRASYAARRSASDCFEFHCADGGGAGSSASASADENRKASSPRAPPRAPRRWCDWPPPSSSSSSSTTDESEPRRPPSVLPSASCDARRSSVSRAMRCISSCRRRSSATCCLASPRCDSRAPRSRASLLHLLQVPRIRGYQLDARVGRSGDHRAARRGPADLRRLLYRHRRRLEAGRRLLELQPRRVLPIATSQFLPEPFKGP